MSVRSIRPPAVWHFFFGTLGPESLCLLRALVGAFVFVELLLMTPHVLRYVPEGSPIPFALVDREIVNGGITLFAWVRSVEGVMILHVIAVLMALAMAVGFMTRLSAFLTWFLYLSIANGALYLWDGGDMVITNVLFWLMLASLAGHAQRCYAVDEWGKGDRSRRGPVPIPAWPVRMLQIQFCLIYFFSGWYKTQKEVWRTGEAIHYVVHQLGLASLDLRWISHAPAAVVVLGYAVMFLELTFPFLVWLKPWKTFMLWSSFALHAVIRVVLHVYSFSVMIPYLIVFVEPKTIRRFTDRHFVNR